MAGSKEKRTITRILKESILHLCKTSTPYSGRLEVDGIICITGQGEGQEIVVKVHEILGHDGGRYHETNGRDFTSHMLHNADEAQDLRKKRRLEDSAYDEASPEYSEMSMEHDYSNATDPDEENSAKDLSLSTTGAIVISPDQADSRSSHSPSPQYHQGLSPEAHGRTNFVGTSMFSGGPGMPYYIPKRTPIKHERWSPNQPIPTVPECKQCGFTFDSFDILAEHNEAVHSVFTCQSCFKTFTSRSNLERHSRLHTGHKPYVCSICGKAFSRKDHLSNHATKHAYKCGTCSKRFSDKKMLVTHYQFDHNAVLTNICDFCNKGFSSSESYEEHVKIHPQFHGDCPESPRPISLAQTSPALPRPTARHPPSPSSTPVNLKKYSCKNCSFSTGDSLTLAKHSLIHAESQRCYTCLACAKMFDDPLHYSDHMLIHQNEVNVFECVICRQLCSTLQSLRRHEANHISDYMEMDMDMYSSPGRNPLPATSSPRFSCPTCHKAFSAQHLLNEHMELHHHQGLHVQEREPHHQSRIQAFACPACNTDFDSYRTLVHHMEKEGHFASGGQSSSSNNDQSAENRSNKRKQTYPKPIQLKVQQSNEADEEDEEDYEKDFEIVEPESPGDAPVAMTTSNNRESKTDENSNSYKKSAEYLVPENPSQAAMETDNKDNVGTEEEEDGESPIKMDPVKSLLFTRSSGNWPKDRPSSSSSSNAAAAASSGTKQESAGDKVLDSPSPAAADARSTTSSRGSPIESNNNNIVLPTQTNTPTSSSSNSSSTATSTPSTPSKVNNVDLPPGPYNCSVCSNICNNFQELEMHCFSEHNRSPCMFCSKTFAQKANRDRHVCLHTGEKPYACPECDEKFSRGDKLKLHRIRAHKVQFPIFNVRSRETSASPSPSQAGGSESRGSENFDNGERAVSLWGKDGAGDEGWPVSLRSKGADISSYSGGHWSINADGPAESVYQGGELAIKVDSPMKLETEVQNNGDAQVDD